MNEQELRELCKVTIKEEIIKNIDSALIFTYIKDLEEKIKMKDKIIKEKIEWLREISDNGLNAVRFATTHDDEIERMQKQKDISTMIGILQELLGESD